MSTRTQEPAQPLELKEQSRACTSPPTRIQHDMWSLTLVLQECTIELEKRLSQNFTSNKAHAKFRGANDVACSVSPFAPLNDHVIYYL